MTGEQEVFWKIANLIHNMLFSGDTSDALLTHISGHPLSLTPQKLSRKIALLMVPWRLRTMNLRNIHIRQLWTTLLYLGYLPHWISSLLLYMPYKDNTEPLWGMLKKWFLLEVDWGCLSLKVLWAIANSKVILWETILANSPKYRINNQTTRRLRIVIMVA